MPRNGIIFGTAMAEKRIENGKVRYSVAYPTGREFGDEPYHIDCITRVCPSGTPIEGIGRNSWLWGLTPWKPPAFNEAL